MVPERSLFSKRKSSPTLLGWTFGFIFLAVVLLNAFCYVELVAVISAVRTRPGWFVANCLGIDLNARGKLKAGKSVDLHHPVNLREERPRPP